MSISPILFYFTAFVIVFGALGMVLSKNLFHSALFMVLSFLGVAGLYATIAEHFMAVVQILVYVGAITILLVFGIMLTAKQGREGTNPMGRYAWIGLFCAAMVAVVFILALLSMNFITVPEQTLENWQTLGISLFGFYILPTEAAAALLLVGMIGAVMLARGGDEK